MRLLAPLVLAGALIAGCGSEDETPGRTVAAAAQIERPGDDRIRDALRLPPRVPLRAVEEAADEDVAVVRGWFVELSRGEVMQAAERFAIPARFQNFTSVAIIKTRDQALAVTDSLPCGARMTESGGAAGFVIYEAELTDRPGGGCGQGIGGVVRGAVLVRDGKMIEWYRLPDKSSPQAGEEVIPDGPVI